VPRQAELPLGPEGPMAGTPQPIVADCGEPLGQHRRQKAPEALVGGPRHRVPTRVLGVLVAKAHLAMIDGEETGVGQRAAVAIAAQVVQDFLRALPRRFAVDHPPLAPDHLGHEQGRAVLAHQIATPATKPLREGMDGDAGGRARWPPVGAVGGDPASRHQAVHRRMVGQGAGPGGADPQDAQQAAHSMRVHGACAERLGRGAPPPVVQVLWVAADEVVERVGPGQDHRQVGPWQPCLPPRCQPHLGVMLGARGTTPVAAGGVGIVRLTAVSTRQPMAPHGLGPAGAKSLQRTAMTGQAIRAQPLLLGGTIRPEDVCPRWHARAPKRVEVGPEGVDGGRHDVEGVGRQLRVARGGTGTLVAQACLADAQRPPPRAQR
jgi:hypothetical protein